MTLYQKEGNLLWPTADANLQIARKIPGTTYTVGADPRRGFYLKVITDFDISGKIYGRTNHHAERIINTFLSRPNSTGVLLDGEKGSGKTMLAKRVSQLAASKQIPTIVINSPYCGDAFNSFIQSIEEPAVIVFDEFEKVYDEEQQEQILTLLDGVFPTKKLFILTANHKWKINENMRNRPGRIFYMISYKGLDAEFIREYCEDNLKNKEHIEQICRLTLLFDAFNFDMLKALVEEMNRYNESPNQVMEMLNAKPGYKGDAKYKVSVSLNGKMLKEDDFYPNLINGNPIANEQMNFNIVNGKKDEDGDDEYDQHIITPKQLKKIDVEDGKFHYVVEKGRDTIVIMFVREKPAAFSYHDLI